MAVAGYAETLAPQRAVRDPRTVLRREPLPRIRLSAGDRAVLLWWAAAHGAFAVLAWAASWLRGTAGVGKISLEGWDAYLLRAIAQHGYTGPGSVPNNEAFFPGHPLALAAVHLAVRSWIASELLLSFAAGAVAMIALARLAGDRRAAGYLLAAPASVFLFVGYSEALFLAFAVCAYLAAVRGLWTAAGLLGFAAAFTRPDGLFLIPALALLALQRPDRLRALTRLSPALLAPALYEAFLVSATGRADAWTAAQRAGWGIRFVWPWTAAHNTWIHATDRVDLSVALVFQTELLAMAAGVAGTVILLAQRRWDQGLYCALLFGSLACTTRYEGVPRALLVAFPLYLLLARAAARRPWTGVLCLSLAAPLAAVAALLYLSGNYAG